MTSIEPKQMLPNEEMGGLALSLQEIEHRPSDVIKDVTKGVLRGVTGPIVTTPFDTLSVKRTYSKQVPLKAAFEGYPKIVLALIPQKIAGGVIFMGSVSVFEKSIGLLTDNSAAKEIGSYAAASGLETLAMSPASVVTLKLRVEPQKGYLEITKEIFKSQGLRGFYRGAGPMTASAIIYNSCFFPGSRKLKEWIEDGKETSPRQQLVNSFTSGCAMSMITSPIIHPIYRIVIEQRLEKGSFWNTVKRLASRNEGVASTIAEFYKGLGPVLVRMPIAGGTVMLTGHAVELLIPYLKNVEFRPNETNLNYHI